MTLKQRALDAAAAAEVDGKRRARTRKRNAEKRARANATDAFRKALELDDDVEGEVILRDSEGTGFVTEHEGLDFQLVATGARANSSYEVYVVLDEMEKHKFKTLAQLGKVLKEHGGAR